MDGEPRFIHLPPQVEANVLRTKCPICYSDIQTRVAYIEVRMMADPPRQFEPYVKVTAWQCLHYESHHGEWREPSEEKA